MPSTDDLAGFRRRQQSAPTDDTSKVANELPAVPADVKKRFPAMVEWEAKMQQWVTKLVIAMRGGQG